MLTVPELLLALEVVRHLKCHVGVADRLSESSSPKAQGSRWEGVERRRKVVVLVEVVRIDAQAF